MDEFQKNLIKQLSDVNKGLIAIGVALFFIGFCVCANAAESVIVSFNDAEHLAALQDSVVGVCDYDSINAGTWISTLEIYYNSPWLNAPDRFQPTISRIIYDVTITCRRLVGVTVTREQGIREIKCYDKQGQYSHTEATMKLGQAIIFYEPYKEEQCIK